MKTLKNPRWLHLGILWHCIKNWKESVKNHGIHTFLQSTHLMALGRRVELLNDVATLSSYPMFFGSTPSNNICRKTEIRRRKYQFKR